MKTKKCLALITFLFGLMLALSSLTSVSANPVANSDEPTYDLGEVTIKCSSGNSGRCFYFACDFSTYDSWCEYVCIWTGCTKNYCSLFAVKLCNSIIGGVL